jgi:hypothetical protein
MTNAHHHDTGRFAGQCHCGLVRFEVTLAEGLDHPIRCTCSYCRMKGSVMVFVDRAQLRLTTGEAALTTYQFNTGAARHYFCSRCGIHTHHQRRFDGAQFAINVACLEGVSPFDLDRVSVVDGANHPLDHGGGPLEVIGAMCFERAVGSRKYRSVGPPTRQPAPTMKPAAARNIAPDGAESLTRHSDPKTIRDESQEN